MTDDVQREPEHRGPSSHVGGDGKPKIGYASKALAKAAARRFRATGGFDQYAYHCGTCPDWHLSKSPRRRLDA
jgi:hypothetical protein